MAVPAASLQEQIAEDRNQIGSTQRMPAHRTVAPALQHAFMVGDPPRHAVQKAAEDGAQYEGKDAKVYS